MRAMVCLIVLALSAVSMPAGAQYHGDDGDDPVSGESKGAFRFHVDTSLFHYASQTRSSDAAGAEDETSTLLAVGNSHGFAGMFGTFSLGAGYAITDAIVLGASAQLGYESLGDADSDEKQGFLLAGFAPYFEYMGGDSSTKPFIGAILQVRHLSVNIPASMGEPETTASQTFLGGGLTGGGHFFMSDACSVDLGARATYSYLASSDPKLPDGTSVSVIDFLVTLGVSAWIL